MMKHTPGPWVVVKHDGDPYYIVPRQGNDALWIRIERDSGSEAKQKANAYLVSAAPDLLAIVGELASELEDKTFCWEMKHHRKRERKILNKAIDIIKSAGGAHAEPDYHGTKGDP